MYSPDDVMGIMFPPRQANGQPPADAILMYEGADKTKNGFAPWRAWDIRGWLNRLTWDVLRFKPIDAGVPSSDRTIPYGMRDTITAIWFLVDQNNQMLHQLLTAAGAHDQAAHFKAARDAAEPDLAQPFDADVAAHLERVDEAAAQQPTGAPAARLDTQTQVAIAHAVAAALNAVAATPAAEAPQAT